MASRILIVDRQSDYSDGEIQAIQSEIDKAHYKIHVFRDLLNSEVVLCAASDIEYSVVEVCDIVGEAYIDGVSS